MSKATKKTLLIDSDQIFTNALANHLLSEHSNSLPDLTQVVILLPNAQAVSQMRNSLGKQSQQALIGGFIGSLDQWLKQNIPPATHAQKQINHATRQLLLLEALKQHPDLFESDNHWQICDSLLELFDELSLSQHQWLNESIPVWVSELQKAYKIDEVSDYLNQEAKIIHTLWNAWQQQLSDMRLVDESSALKYRLLEAIPESTKDLTFYIAGLEQLSPLQQAWCNNLAQTNKVVNVIQGNTNLSTHIQKEPNDNLILLQNIYSHEHPLFSKAKHYLNSKHKYFLENIKLYDAQSAEQETQAVDLKVRMSLLDGKRNIAVVTENRKLARRLRALLERADVVIQDTAGWALATTSAATVLERWLECIEQDFSYQSFLDLLKSPFFCDQENYGNHLDLIYRFEQDIILHENISNDLQRYKQAITNRKERLNISSSSTAEQLLSLLDTIESAATELIHLYKQQDTFTSDIWISTFKRSIEKLGIYQQLGNDIAGTRIQQEIDSLTHAHSSAQPEMNWQDFRTWLGSSLEREQFKPHDQSAIVKVMNIQQAQYCQFETLIIAGANMQSLPGSASQHPFFNQSVRQALQLKNWHETKEYTFYQFQQLLFAADDILITWQAEKNGEWMQPSPWISSLEDFSLHGFQSSLKDKSLDALIRQTNPVTDRSEALLQGINTATKAKPVLQDELIPNTYSASRHQRLIDCPYKFFASDALRLKPLEEITQELMKSEYGEKVHLVLQAFHQQCPNLPAPFPEALTKQNKPQALQHIENLSRTVFNAHSEDSIQQRGWLDRWLQTASAYINWQIKRQEEWNIYKLEEHVEQTLTDDIKIVGRLDRVDNQANQYSIIDYKTGATAKQQDIDLAENIQLTSYAMLMENIHSTLYLKLDKGEVKQAGIIESEQLDKLKRDSLQRLEISISEIKSGTPLTSWGDEQSCNYCDMSGLCRKQTWESA